MSYLVHYRTFWRTLVPLDLAYKSVTAPIIYKTVNYLTLQTPLHYPLDSTLQSAFYSIPNILISQFSIKKLLYMKNQPHFHQSKIVFGFEHRSFDKKCRKIVKWHIKIFSTKFQQTILWNPPLGSALAFSGIMKSKLVQSSFVERCRRWGPGRRVV